MASLRQAGLGRAYGQLRNVLSVLGAIVLIWAVVLAAIWLFTDSGDEAPPAVAGTTTTQSTGLFAGTTSGQQSGMFDPTNTQQQLGDPAGGQTYTIPAPK